LPYLRHLRRLLIMTSMNLPQIEEKILKFWDKKKIFLKSLAKTKNGSRFIFFEGPPTANGLPGIHHVEARAFKDIILRFKTMRGFFVERKAGWDTHGLPVEIQVERKLGLKSKKDIERYGIEKFNKKCKESVWQYKNDWEKLTARMAFWLDLKNPYITYENDYIESVWHILKEIFNKGLLYKGERVVPYCPRCGTALSSHEVALGYKNVKEPSIYFKLPVKAEHASYFLVWTTTPWTLPGNTALAVGENINYVKVKLGEEKYILAKDRLNVLGGSYEIESEFLGGALVGREYEPVFPMKLNKSGYRVVAADFVSIQDGTGIVHIAPSFGIEDMELGQKEGLPSVMTVELDGQVKKGLRIPGEGKFVKEADEDIRADLKKRKLLFKEEAYEHDYPFCWRCDTPLIYYAKTCWFIKMTAVRERLLANNGQINWEPAHLQDGRFGEWLREVKDWNLSRERYWGTPLPIWECEKCREIKAVGSVKELGKKLKDLHRPHIDKITFACPKCSGVMKRAPFVIDCWFDSGSMPFAQWHYPFENKEKIDEKEAFPADYICEAVDQTRGWFYTLLAISTLLEKGPAYKNAVSVGHVLDVKGQKMSKSKGNIVYPMDVINQFGSDAVRWYLFTVNQAGEPKHFDLREVKDKFNRFFGTLYNTYLFFDTYADKNFKPVKNYKPKNILDRWIFSLLGSLAREATERLDHYDIVSGARAFEKFVDDLSNWYVRRSRRRFQKPENEREKNEAAQTLYFVLLNLAKLAAPFIPFISEEIYLNLKKSKMPESVHLCDYPVPDKKFIDKNLEEKMAQARQIVALALAERAQAGIKVRQPLQELKIKNEKLKTDKDLLNLIKDEVNIKQIEFDPASKDEVKLDKKITKELKEEGIAREIIRQIQDMRKELRLTRKDRVAINFQYPISNIQLNKLFEKWQDFILKETISQKAGDKKMKFDLAKDIQIDNDKVKAAIKRVK
jgi:isoleucyl-tRNA synthetase